MTEYTQETLEKVIKEQQEKIHSLIQSLRLKHVQRERVEAEIVELNVEIGKINDFIDLMQGIQNGIEDRAICAGLKKMRKENRDKRVSDKS
jgi:hypothetical protein